MTGATEALGDTLPDIALAARLFDELRARTGDGRGITRASYGAGEAIAHAIVRREAERLGMSCRTDAAANLTMTLPGARTGPAVVIGSHLDSVPVGGNFDGAAGVLLGLAVAAGYRAAGVTPPAPLAVMAIRAEESTWFPASYIGSRGAFGRLRPAELDLPRAGDGVTLGQAIAAAGGDPAATTQARTLPHVGLFLEAHIEQGPVLASAGPAVAVVSGIRGSLRRRDAVCHGQYAHSGATPRGWRQDAALAVARLVIRLDEAWQRMAALGHDLTVTFGRIATDPAEAAFSKVAGRVEFSVDIRSASRETLALMRDELLRAVAEAEAATGTRFDLGPETGSEPALMDARLIAALVRAGGGVPVMPCGAGHDAAVFAGQGIPAAMVFIRNAHGSHNPDEAMDMADFALAARLVSAFCLADPLGALA